MVIIDKSPPRNVTKTELKEICNYPQQMKYVAFREHPLEGPIRREGQ